MYKTAAEKRCLMHVLGLDKKAYNFRDLSHPDNRTANMVAGGIGGGALTAALSYLLARAAGSESPWLWGLGGAITGAPTGAYLANKYTDRWADMDSAAKAVNEWSEPIREKIDKYVDWQHKHPFRAAIDLSAHKNMIDDITSKANDTEVLTKKLTSAGVKGITTGVKFDPTQGKLTFSTGINPLEGYRIKED